MIILYIVSQAICVVTSTIKSVMLLKSSKMTATIMSTIHYGINAVVTFLIAKQSNLWIVLVTSVVTNLIGTFIGLTIAEKTRKEQLWRISATVKIADYDNLINELKENNIKFITFQTDWERIKLIDVFSKGREESDMIHKIFSHYKIKYTISNSHYQL